MKIVSAAAALGFCQISGSVALAAADAIDRTNVDNLTVSVGLMISGIVFTFGFAWRIATWRAGLERKIDTLGQNQRALARGLRANRQVLRYLLMRSGVGEDFLPPLPELRMLDGRGADERQKIVEAGNFEGSVVEPADVVSGAERADAD